MSSFISISTLSLPFPASDFLLAQSRDCCVIQADLEETRELPDQFR